MEILTIYLKLGEKAEITLVVPEGWVDKNDNFQIEVKPASGATLTIKKTVPSSIEFVL